VLAQWWQRHMRTRPNTNHSRLTLCRTFV
jgi:hypothetical protein